jgi:hypothetical protein
LTGHEIAREIGRSKSVVYKHIRVKSEPNWTDEEMSILTEGYLRGWPTSKIAKKLKRRTPLAVRLRMCRYRKKVRNDPEIKKAAALLDMAMRAGLSPGRAIQRIRTCDAYAKMKMESENIYDL